jgi:hypothetical protein
MNWPLAALSPRSSQYALRFLVFVNDRSMMLRAARVFDGPAPGIKVLPTVAAET